MPFARFEQVTVARGVPFAPFPRGIVGRGAPLALRRPEEIPKGAERIFVQPGGIRIGRTVVVGRPERPFLPPSPVKPPISREEWKRRRRSAWRKLREKMERRRKMMARRRRPLPTFPARRPREDEDIGVPTLQPPRKLRKVRRPPTPVRRSIPLYQVVTGGTLVGPSSRGMYHARREMIKASEYVSRGGREARRVGWVRRAVNFLKQGTKIIGLDPGAEAIVRKAGRSLGISV